MKYKILRNNQEIDGLFPKRKSAFDVANKMKQRNPGDRIVIANEHGVIEGTQPKWNPQLR